MATKTLVTRFGHADEAESAASRLRDEGFGRDAVGWVTRERGREIAHGNLVQRTQQKGSTSGRAVIGGVLGGMLGLLIGIIAMTMAGSSGAIFIAVSLVVAFVGIAIGAALGRRIDAFVRVDTPPPVAREQAHRYAAQLGSHAAVVMVTVKNEEQESRALEILRGEADLHMHPLVWRIPALSDEGRPSKPSLA